MNRLAITILIALLLLQLPLLASEENPAEISREDRYREIAQQIKLFGEIYRDVNQRYVEDIDPSDFIEAGIEGMLETLDPYTVYFKPEKLDDLEMLTKGEYGGVGIEIGTRGKQRELTVISPIEDTPAERKGIKSGDVIIAVEGESTDGWTTQDASEKIRGEPGTDVTLTIRRAGFDKPLDYVLTRDAIRIHDVAYSGIIDGDIGYIKLVRFSGNAAEELIQALDEVLAEKPKGLILDLRSNPGGLLPSAVQISEQFLEPGDNIVSTRGRINSSHREFKAMSQPRVGDLPLVVLVNGGSASASEILAGAIQDHDRGVILGTQSFGKGLVQSVMNLSSGAALKLTTARYYTPSGRLIQRDRDKEEDTTDEPELMEDDLENMTHIEGKTSATDSSDFIFYTDNGRQVYGGGGITPDVTVELSLLNTTIVEMYRKDYFFSFMDKYMNEHSDIDTVQVTDHMVDNFTAYIEEQDFTPQGDGDKELERLRKIAERDSLDTEFLAILDQAESILMEKRKHDSPEMRELIFQSLDREMASRLGGRIWRIKSTFDEDEQLSQALVIVRDQSRYNSILQGPTRADIGK
ncbi:S41 family peptidase [Calditrichota bacterium]